MRLHAARGDRASALRVYHTCVEVLQRELGVEPGPAVRAIYQRLVNIDPQRIPSTPVTRLPLIGREKEWAILQSTWRNTTPNRPHFILITGEAGIGKTRLLEEFAEWSDRQGIGLAGAQCHAAEERLAYAPVTAWLQARPLPVLEDVWLTEVARLLPELLIERTSLPHPERLMDSWQRLRLFKALALAMLKNRSALILLLDDMQWCDRDTLEWLHYLLRWRRVFSPAGC
jgi:predicted ATPase